MAFPIFSSKSGDVLSNALPADTAMTPGGATSAAGVRPNGNMWSQSPAGGLAPGGTGSGYVVAVATIPAGAFDTAGRGLLVRVQGNFGANGNTKTVSLVVNPTNPVVGSVVSGGTTIATTGAVTTNGSGWNIQASITKTGAAGSNTQNATNSAVTVGSAGAALTAAQALTLNEAAAITVVVVANSATTASDITLWNFQGEWSN